MALIVENGTNVANADCYADVAACSAWAVAYYGSSLNGNNADKEAAIRRAVAYLDSLPWKGARTYGRAQPLAWPRTGITEIGANEIPREVIFAQHVLARAEFQSPGVLTPSASRLGVKREKVDVLEVEYDTSTATGSIEDARTIVTMAMDRLAGLLTRRIGGGYVPYGVTV